MNREEKIGKIFIISGPSGSGKTTLYKQLLTGNQNLNKIISVTTRKKRQGEKHGKDYVFVSQKMFLYKQRFGHFLESEKVFDNYYGTPYKNVRDFLKIGKNVLLCIDVKGAKTVCSKFLGAIRIFIKTPSLEELKSRLEKRGSEDLKIIHRRLAEARKELKEARQYDYVVVNDDLKAAGLKLKKIIQKASIL